MKFDLTISTLIINILTTPFIQTVFCSEGVDVFETNSAVLGQFDQSKQFIDILFQCFAYFPQQFQNNPQRRSSSVCYKHSTFITLKSSPIDL